MQIIGNREIKEGLLRLAKQKSPPSLLFAGPEGVGKSLFAEMFAKELLGEVPHPDLYVFKPEGKTAQHTIESVRHLTEEVYRSPYLASHKVFIIHEADRMMATSSNALLKTFEEPLLTSVIILLTSKKEKILETILSRCQIIPFRPIPQEEIEQFLCEKGVSLEEAKRCARGSKGSLSMALKLLEGDPVRNYLNQILAQKAFSHYPTLLEVSKELASLIEAKAPEEKPIEALLTAIQKEAYQKEFEGVSRLCLAEEFYSVLDAIYYWYRDKVLLQVGASSQLCFHENASATHLLSLKKVEKEIVNARVRFERSTSIQICLENLFLSLSV
jgi:DNA polymerase-3 subunit delta'